jgi:hypothetical protein
VFGREGGHGVAVGVEGALVPAFPPRVPRRAPPLVERGLDSLLAGAVVLRPVLEQFEAVVRRRVVRRRHLDSVPPPAGEGERGRRDGPEDDGLCARGLDARGDRVGEPRPREPAVPTHGDRVGLPADRAPDRQRELRGD